MSSLDFQATSQAQARCVLHGDVRRRGSGSLGVFLTPCSPARLSRRCQPSTKNPRKARSQSHRPACLTDEACEPGETLAGNTTSTNLYERGFTHHPPLVVPVPLFIISKIRPLSVDRFFCLVTSHLITLPRYAGQLARWAWCKRIPSF